jgi:hypothetical protein
MSELPDIDGFFEAQDRLREATGTNVRFLVPVDPVWPEGTQLDPETDLPYDPTIVPESGGDDTEVVIRCSTLTQLVNAQMSDATEERAGGVFRGESAALGFAPADLPLVQAARRFVLGDLTYRVTDMVADEKFNRIGRYMVFGEAV